MRNSTRNKALEDKLVELTVRCVKINTLLSLPSTNYVDIKSIRSEMVAAAAKLDKVRRKLWALS